MLKLAIKFVLFQLTQAIPAYEIYSSKRNTIGLDLVSNISEKKAFLGINWFIDYEQDQKISNSKEPFYKPLIRILAITDKEVFLKKFNDIWFDLNPQDPQNLEIHPHFVTTANNPITAYQMDNNQSILTVALKNLTVLTINTSQALDPKDPRFNPIMLFDSSYKFSEGTEIIRSIAQIPYTNEIIFSSNRFEILKINKLTQEVIHRGRSPLDSTNFIVTPVPTHRQNYDPHNPNKKPDPALSQRVKVFTETMYFVMTSADSGTNSLVDWTSMKTIRYFSMRDGEQKVADEGIKYRVRSICFFGGSPRANMYAFVGSNVIKYLFLFSAINRNMLAKPELSEFSTGATLTWVNHTNFIYIFQTGILGKSSFKFRSTFYYLGPKTQEGFFSRQDKINYFSDKFLNPTMLAFSTNITSNEVYDEIYDHLDYFYLFLTTSGNSISIDIPPFNWDRCAFGYDSKSHLRMYYGRYRHCSETGCISGYENRPNYDSLRDEIAIQCKKQLCENELIMHVASRGFDGYIDKIFPKFNPSETDAHWSSQDGKINYTKSGKNIRMQSEKNALFCLERYRLKENELDVVNDNGCSRGFNMDPSGICRACGYMEYPDTDVGFYPSDCLLWLQLSKTSEDTLTYSYYHYNKTLLDEELHYKGFTGDEFYYRKMFYEKKDKEGKVTREIRDYVGSLGHDNIRQSDSYLMLKRCYSLIYNQAKTPKYDIKAFHGYTLSFISNDPTEQAKRQEDQYGEKSPLHTFYCRKSCLQGYYYDFNSISCRRCNYGCALCQRFDKCDLCQPGFNQVKKPMHSVHEVDDEMIGQCQLGCQDGFYANAFDGECLECQENCLQCIDSLFVFREKYEEKKNNPSFCLDCSQDPKKEAQKNLINLENGVCQSGCEKKISTGSVMKGMKREFCHEYGRGCKDCEIPDTSKCLSCSPRFYFQKETKECLKLTETSKFKIYLLTGSSFIFIVLFSLGLIVICQVIRGEIADKERKDRMKFLLSSWKRRRRRFSVNKRLNKAEAGAKIVHAIRDYLNKKKRAQKNWKESIERGKSSRNSRRVNDNIQFSMKIYLKY